LSAAPLPRSTLRFHCREPRLQSDVFPSVRRCSPAEARWEMPSRR
jgi:hypothetical protein